MDTANMLWVMLRSNTSQFGQNEITISREEFVKCVDYGLTLVVNMERERCADTNAEWNEALSAALINVLDPLNKCHVTLFFNKLFNLDDILITIDKL
jgi:hypothetical protein